MHAQLTNEISVLDQQGSGTDDDVKAPKAGEKSYKEENGPAADRNKSYKSGEDSSPCARAAPTGTSEWLISTSGKHKLCKDLVASNAQASTAVIVIDADDVELDLCGHLVGTTCDDPASIGIQVLGRKRVSIKNGRVRGFTLSGIMSIGNIGISIERVRIKRIGKRVDFSPLATGAGITHLGDTGVRLRCCKIDGVVTSTGNNAGVFGSLCTDVSIKGCDSRNHVNLGGPVAGFQFIACSKLSFWRCNASDCRSEPGNLPFFSHTVGGFYVVLSSEVSIEKCVAERLSGGCDDAHSFPIFLCPTTILISQCIARDVRDGFNDVTHSGAKATGFEIDGSNNVVVRRCLAERIVAHNPEDKQAAGFTDGLCINVLFLECVSRNNRVVLDNKSIGRGDSFGVGFGWAPDPRPPFIGNANGTRWVKCLAEGNDIGFNLFKHIVGELVDSVSRRNRVYGVFNGGLITVSCHPCTECNPPITTTIPNNGSFNVIINNLVCGNGRQNIFDTNPSSENLYRFNRTCSTSS